MGQSDLAREEVIDRVAELYFQGRKVKEIGDAIGKDAQTVRKYLDLYEESIKNRAETDPEIFDRRLENTHRFLDQYDLMIKKAWDVHNKAEENDIVTTQLSALKQIDELVTKKARLMNLLNQQQENMYLEKSRKAERANEILSDVLQNTVADCDRCRPLAWNKIQEAFGMMDKKVILDAEALPGK